MKEETIKTKVRKVFKFLQQKEQGRDEHDNNGYIILSGKKYFVGKMSYDEWYLEPYFKGRTEIDTFTRETLWETQDFLEILQIFQENNLIDLIIK